jgi:hypothetical protein
VLPSVDQSYAPTSALPPSTSRETKMPWSSAVEVVCVSALRVRRTLSVSALISVHADQSPALLARAATRPAGVPSSLAKRNWPSQPPPLFRPQSIAASV